MTKLPFDENDIINLVAHELKSPLTATRGFIDLVLASDDLNPDQRQYLNRAQISLDRTVVLVKNLLEWSRLMSQQTVTLSAVNLRHIIESQVEELSGWAMVQNVTISAEIAPDAGRILADETLITHLIGNLINNAIKYNRDGGQVWVSARRTPKAVEINVRDTGIGIAPDDHERIFERFYRVSNRDKRTEGTGLGLAIAQMIVQLHKGEIHLESVPDEGSTFTVTLPIQAKPYTANRGGLKEPNFYASGEIIDAVDDDLQERPENADRERDDL